MSAADTEGGRGDDSVLQTDTSEVSEEGGVTIRELTRGEQQVGGPTVVGLVMKRVVLVPRADHCDCISEELTLPHALTRAHPHCGQLLHTGTTIVYKSAKYDLRVRIK